MKKFDVEESGLATTLNTAQKKILTALNTADAQLQEATESVETARAERDKHIGSLYKAGVPTTKIGRHLGLSAAAVTNAVRRAGVEMRRLQ